MIVKCLEKAFEMGLEVLWISALNHVVEYYCRFGFHIESDYYMEEHI
jgi:predicted GNAT family N-acyltransferase